MSFADQYRDSRLKDKSRRLSAEPTKAKPTDASGVSRFRLAQALLEHERSGWLKWLRENYRVKLQLVSDSPRELPTDSPRPLDEVRPIRPASKLGQNVRDLLSAQQGSPTAALMLFTDGATTSGPTLTDAAETARRQGVPLFLIGVGSSQPPRDVRLAELLADDVAFSGDAVQVQLQLLAEGMQGQATTVRLKRADTDEVLAEQAIKLEKNSLRLPISLTFRPQATGSLSLVVEASSVPGESDAANNRLTHTLHVNDVAIKVLLIQAYPSFEFRFLKNLLSRATRSSGPAEKAFELTTILQNAEREHAEQDPSRLVCSGSKG